MSSCPTGKKLEILQPLQNHIPMRNSTRKHRKKKGILRNPGRNIFCPKNKFLKSGITNLGLALSLIIFKAHAITHVTINWPKILSNKHTCMVHNKHLSSLTTPDIDYNDYQAIIIKAGELTATHYYRQFDRWFQIVIPPLLCS